MFLHLFDQRQREAFCRIALFLTSSDGITDIREEIAIERAWRELGRPIDDLPPVPANEEEALAGVESAFVSGESRRILLLEAVRVALADGKTDDIQRQLFHDLCQLWGYPDPVLRNYRDFALRAIQLRAEGEGLIYDE